MLRIARRAALLASVPLGVACGTGERLGPPVTTATGGADAAGGASGGGGSVSTGGTGGVIAGGGGAGGDGADGGAGGDGADGGAGGGGASQGGGGATGDCSNVGEELACYEGDPKYAGVGACKKGTRKCELVGEFLTWGPCLGSVAPTTEQCGDSEDSDCDGDANNGCLACDGVSPIWTDPFKDGSLRLKGTATAGLDAGPNSFSWMCVQDTARINVCKDTVIELAGGTPTIVGGGGIGAAGAFPVMITLKSQASDALWVLLDATAADITLLVDTPKAPVTVTSKGKHMVSFGGNVYGVVVVTEGSLTLLGINASGGGVSCKGGGGPLSPPGGCP